MQRIFSVDGLSRKEKCLLGLVTAFLISLFLPDMPMVGNILIAGIFVCCLFFDSPAEKWRLLRSRAAILLMLLFFLLQTISAVVSVDGREGLSMLELRSPLVVFPLSLGSITIRPAVKVRLLAVYCFATTSMALFCLVHAGLRVWHTGDAEWLYDDSLTEIIGRQSVYVALMVVLAIFGFVYLLGEGIRRWLVWPAIGVLLCFHYLLASRVSILTLYCILLGYGCWLVWRRGKRRMLAGAVILAIVAAGCLFFFPKTLNRFRELRYTQYSFNNTGVESHYNMPVTKDQWNGANIRLAIWRCGLDLMPGHWISGIPLGDKRARLVSQFKMRDFELAYRTRRNLHNTYLDVLVNTGIPGLVIFLLGYLVLPMVAAWRGGETGRRRKARRGRDWLGMGIVAAFAAAMVTETWIDRSFGCVLLGFFLSCMGAWGAARIDPARSPDQSRVSPDQSRISPDQSRISPVSRSYLRDIASRPLRYRRNRRAGRGSDRQPGDSIAGSSTSYGSPE